MGINTTTPQGALEIVGYNNTYRIKFGTTLSTGTPYGANRIYSNGLFRFLSTYYTDEIATFHRIDNYDDPVNAIEYFSIKTSGINVTGNISATGTITTTGGTINGTLNCTTGIFSSLSTTGNTNQAIPSLGNFGGTGDKLIISPGTSTTYPYSLGMESNSLWMSSPNTIKFYNNGTSYVNIDSSGLLTTQNIICNNRIGIGLTNPGTNYKLDVLGNVNCSEIYRNGTPISSTLSSFLPLTGGLLSGNLTGTSCSMTSVSANTFSGSGAALTNLNVSNTTSGTLSISRGGIGTTTLTANQILIGNATTSILQSANLTWDSSNNRLGIGKTNPSTTLDISGNITSLGGTINGTLNCTTGIFNSLSTTSNTNQAIPSVGNFGGTGDKLIISPGTSTSYPYSLGIETNSLWMSSPNAIKLYNKGINSVLIDSSGNVTCSGTLNGTNIYTTGNLGIGNNNNLGSLVVGSIDADGSDGSIVISKRQNTNIKRNFKIGMDGDYNLCFADFGFANTGNTWRPTDFTIGYNAGNVGIGTKNQSQKLYVNGTTYLNGDTTVNGVLNTTNALNITSTTTDNQIVITNSAATRYTSIKFNNGTVNGYIGIGGSGLTGTSYYNNNVFIEANNSFIIQTGLQNTANIPRMIINTSGNVGIATTNPNNILQVGDGARLRISNGITDYSLIGTKDVDDTNNTRIVISGNTRSYNPGCIEYVATGTGDHIFYTNGSERMRIEDNGNVSVGGYIYAGGTTTGLRINGNDYGNTIYQDAATIGGQPANIGFTLRNANTFNFNSLSTSGGGYTNIMNMNTNSISLNKNTIISGLANIHNGSPYAVSNNFMASGSLTIGGTTANYGCGYNWSSSTAGLLMECLDNTEIAIHDSGNRVVSAIAYYGGATNNRIIIGRDMFWGSTPVTIPNSLTIDGSLYFTNRIQDHILNLYGTANYSFGINSGTLRYNSDGVHKFYCGGAESTTIDNKGIIIGTFTNHYYPLVVNKTINGTLSYVYVRTGWNGGSDYNTNSYTADISAAFAGAIHVSANILNSSDIRIKKEINDINDDGALQQILAIEPKTYKYIDYLSKGNSNVYGFIAQQVKEVIPHAVELVKDIIPNIYKRAICNSNIITLENDVSQDLNINDNIKIYDEFGKDDIYNITEINENTIKIDKEINSSNVFVYGKEIDDFHTLKKDYIFTLNVCATQELYKLIQKQETIINDLMNRIIKLENQNI